MMKKTTTPSIQSINDECSISSSANTSDYSYAEEDEPPQDSDILQSIETQTKYKIQELSDVSDSIQCLVKSISDMISVQHGSAMALLIYFKGDLHYLQEVYFEQREYFLKKCGLYNREVIGNSNNSPSYTIAEKMTCAICGDETECFGMDCQHKFCRDCWTNFMSSMMTNGPMCVRTTCPAYKCDEIVTAEEVQYFSSEIIVAKFKQFQINCFIDSSKFMKWCPGISCPSRVAVMDSDIPPQTYADCLCGASFCLFCDEEAHAPASCETVKSWKSYLGQNKASSTWISQNSKPCPNCHVNISKNGGCNHMRCSQCSFHFCWLCMRDWNIHGYNGSCNKYDVENADKARQEAFDLQRFIHFCDRYDAHDKGQQFAEKEFRLLEQKLNSETEELQEVDSASRPYILKSVFNQIVMCRRVLKYTYVCGYYLEYRNELFEDNQGLLESFTERLSEQSEKPEHEFDVIEANQLVQAVRKYAQNMQGLNPEFQY